MTKKTAQQLQYEFIQKCSKKERYYTEYYEKIVALRLKKDLEELSAKGEKKYQSWLKRETIKHDQKLKNLEREEKGHKIVTYKKPDNTPTLQDYEKISDIVASILCRVQKMDRNGIVRCTTCSGSAFFWEGSVVGAGHFVSRKCKPIRWSGDNIRPQCFSCNDKNRGNGRRSEMRLALVQDIGEGRVSKLETIEKLDAQKVDGVLVYPKIPRHKEFIVEFLEEIEKICESKMMQYQLSEMSSYQKAKRFAGKWC